MKILTALDRVAIWHESAVDTGGFDSLAVTNRLHDEFNQWAGPMREQGKIGPYPANPVTYWPYVERFMKEKYPAAHKGFDMGHEEARPAINRGLKDPTKSVYETGPDAVAKYGYDPMETAAGMVLLHSNGRPTSDRMNKQMLTNIYKNRVQMQQQHDQKVGV